LPMLSRTSKDAKWQLLRQAAHQVFYKGLQELDLRAHNAAYSFSKKQHHVEGLQQCGIESNSSWKPLFHDSAFFFQIILDIPAKEVMLHGTKLYGGQYCKTWPLQPYCDLFYTTLLNSNTSTFIGHLSVAITQSVQHLWASMTEFSVWNSEDGLQRGLAPIETIQQFLRQDSSASFSHILKIVKQQDKKRLAKKEQQDIDSILINL